MMSSSQLINKTFQSIISISNILITKLPKKKIIQHRVRIYSTNFSNQSTAIKCALLNLILFFSPITILSQENDNLCEVAINLIPLLYD